MHWRFFMFLVGFLWDGEKEKSRMRIYTYGIDECNLHEILLSVSSHMAMCFSLINHTSRLCNLPLFPLPFTVRVFR